MRKFLTFISFIIGFTAYSQNRVIQTSYAENQFNIGKFVELYIDSINRPVNAIANSHSFKQSESTVINAGISKSRVWVRFCIQSNDDASVLQIANPILDEVVFYHWKNGEIADSNYLSESLPLDQREFKDQNYIFKIRQSAHSIDTFLLSIKASEQILLPIQLTSYTLIDEENQKRDIINGIYYGIMLVMFFYNFFLFLTVKDRNYLYYIVYILFVALTQLTLQGFGYRYFWSEFPFISRVSVHFNGAMSGITTILFTQQFLNTKHYLKRLNYVLNLILIIDLLAIALAFVGIYQISYQLIDLNAGIGSLIVLCFAIYISYKGNRSAKYFLLAWGIFLVSVIIFVLKDFEVLPYNNSTRYILLAGSALEVTLLSFALADRINILKKEKELSQAEALRIAQENEQIIREQNIILETKVTERTAELSHTLDELKSTQTLLVESEKMSSLGQLTAGIAHEINNPINFVTSNISPLKRDMDMVFDVMEKIEGLSVSDIGTLEKQEKIHELKQEVDFDYLKTEIDFLMKGISEGSTRTAEIVKGLRIFSRLDEDDLKHADINEGLDSTIIIVTNQLDNQIQIIKNYGNIPLVDCYPGKLNQVFLNILTNAIYAVKAKFDQSSGGQITISTKAEGDHLFISFFDNGIGMDDATKHKLFEPFFTTKPVGEGTGLGLSIVYNTIKKHNGTIHVNSTLGEGTEFIIEIPIVQHLS